MASNREESVKGAFLPRVSGFINNDWPWYSQSTGFMEIRNMKNMNRRTKKQRREEPDRETEMEGGKKAVGLGIYETLCL
jgi:hypothetical protein